MRRATPHVHAVYAAHAAHAAPPLQKLEQSARTLGEGEQRPKWMVEQLEAVLKTEEKVGLCVGGVSCKHVCMCGEVGWGGVG